MALGRAFRSEATTSGPIVIFGTKWPSITSTCSPVPRPSSAAFASSASRAKFAESIEGASSMVMGSGRLLPMTIELAPSILSANFARLAEDAKAALEGGGTVLHVDVMDGHFVPNITIGPLVVASLRKALPNAIIDGHLMIENPVNYIPALAEAVT